MPYSRNASSERPASPFNCFSRRIRAQSSSELKPNYARAYYNRAIARKEKGDTSGATADFERARELDPELVSEDSVGDSINSGGSANNSAAETTVSLLDGKLKLDIPPDFPRDPDDPKEPKTVAKFSGPAGA
jgi:tetratricopeptide (TPR) repeat protein